MAVGVPAKQREVKGCRAAETWPALGHQGLLAALVQPAWSGMAASASSEMVAVLPLLGPTPEHHQLQARPQSAAHDTRFRMSGWRS